MSNILNYIDTKKKPLKVIRTPQILNLNLRQDKKYHSALVDDKFTLLGNKGVRFDSGVTYTEKELIVMSNMEREIRKRTHYIKGMFEGEILRNGKVA